MRCKNSVLPNAVFVVAAVHDPLVTTPSTSLNDTFCVRLTFDARLFEIVSVKEPAPDADARLILFPATSANETALPVTLVPPPLKLCVAAGTEMVTLPAPTPTLAMPAPENERALLKLPVELLVEFAITDIETVLKFVTLGVVAEIVTVLPLKPILAIPAPEKMSGLEYVPVEFVKVFPTAVRETVPAPPDAPMIWMLLAPVESVILFPAEMTTVPVEDAKPAADIAFSPLNETVIAPAAVAVCKLILLPATNAREMAVPVMLVPDALIVCVPSAAADGPMIVTSPADDESVTFDPAAKRIGPDATVVVPSVAPPAVNESIPKLLTSAPAAAGPKIVSDGFVLN